MSGFEFQEDTIEPQLLFGNEGLKSQEFQAGGGKGHRADDDVFEFIRDGFHRADSGHRVAGIGLGGVIDHGVGEHLAGPLDGERGADPVGAGRGDIEHEVEVAAFPGAQLGIEHLASGGFRSGASVVAVAAQLEVGGGLGRNGMRSWKKSLGKVGMGDTSLVLAVWRSDNCHLTFGVKRENRQSR